MGRLEPSEDKLLLKYGYILLMSINKFTCFSLTAHKILFCTCFCFYQPHFPTLGCIFIFLISQKAQKMIKTTHEEEAADDDYDEEEDEEHTVLWSNYSYIILYIHIDMT